MITPYTALIEYGICITEEEKLASSANYATKFAYGFVNEAFNTFDVDAMADGSKEVLEALMVKLKCVIQNLREGGDLAKHIECLFGVSPADAPALYDAIKLYTENCLGNNIGDAYIHGQLVCFVISTIIPYVGQASKATRIPMLVAKATKMGKGAATVKKIGMLGKLLKGIAGKTVREIITILTNNASMLECDPDMTQDVAEVVVAGSAFYGRLEDLGFTNLKTKVEALDATSETAFINDFKDAVNADLVKLNADVSLVDVWKKFRHGTKNIDFLSKLKPNYLALLSLAEQNAFNVAINQYFVGWKKNAK